MSAFPYTDNWSAMDIVKHTASLGFIVLHQPAQTLKLRGGHTVHHEARYTFHVDNPATSKLGFGPFVTVYNSDYGLRSAAGASLAAVQRAFTPLIDPNTYPKPRCVHHYFLDRYAGLLEDAGYGREHVAQSLALWLTVCGTMLVNSANPEPYLLHRMQRCAHLASYPQLDLAQKVDAAKRDISTAYLDEALAAGAPYFMIQDAYPLADTLREFEPSTALLKGRH